MKSRRFDPHVNRNSQGKKINFPKASRGWLLAFEKHENYAPGNDNFCRSKLQDIVYPEDVKKFFMVSKLHFFSRRNLQRKLNFLGHRYKRQNHLLWSPKWLHFSSLFPHCLLSEEVDKKWIFSGVEDEIEFNSNIGNDKKSYDEDVWSTQKKIMCD